MMHTMEDVESLVTHVFTPNLYFEIKATKQQQLKSLQQTINCDDVLSSRFINLSFPFLNFPFSRIKEEKPKHYLLISAEWLFVFDDETN
jgi:hypothetical protein